MPEPVQGSLEFPVTIEGVAGSIGIDVRPDRLVGDIAAATKMGAVTGLAEGEFEIGFEGNSAAIPDSITIGEAGAGPNSQLWIRPKAPSLPVGDIALTSKTLMVAHRAAPLLNMKISGPNLALKPHTDEQRAQHYHIIHDLPKPAKNVKILVWSLKGGAAKSTTAIELSQILALLLGASAGNMVLVDGNDHNGHLAAMTTPGREYPVDKFLKRIRHKPGELKPHIPTSALLGPLPKTDLGVNVIGMSQSIEGMEALTREDYRDLFDVLDQHADITIIEGSISPKSLTTKAALEVADHVIFVANAREVEASQIEMGTSYLAKNKIPYTLLMSKVDTRIDRLSAIANPDGSYVVEISKHEQKPQGVSVDHNLITMTLRGCSGIVTVPDDRAASEAIVKPEWNWRGKLPASLDFPIHRMAAMVTLGWTPLYQEMARKAAREENALAALEGRELTVG